MTVPDLERQRALLDMSGRSRRVAGNVAREISPFCTAQLAVAGVPQPDGAPTDLNWRGRAGDCPVLVARARRFKGCRVDAVDWGLASDPGRVGGPYPVAWVSWPGRRRC